MKNVNVTFGDGVIDDLAKMGIDAEKEVNRAIGRQRIQELAEQAGFDVKSLLAPHPGGFPKEDFLALEKFAQLLIMESIGVVNKRYMGDNNREDMEVRRCVEDLKKHFGVE